MSNLNSSTLSSKGNTKAQRPFRERLMYTPTYQRASLFVNYLISRYKGYRNHELFDQVRTYCVFTGHARSGHSIVGALLDAHRNAVIADEVDALKYVDAGFNRDQIYYILLSKAQKIHTHKGRLKPGRDGKTYSYAVPEQWQGRFGKLYVIGDTKAGISTIRIGQDPEILHRLKNLMPGVNVRIINVVRNPYDNVSTMMIRSGRGFEEVINEYFGNCVVVADLYKNLDRSQFLMIRQEDVINQPQDTLREMCSFLGLEAPADYLEACASILYNSPAKSRYKINWPPELIESVQHKIDQFDFLCGYTYEE